MAKRTPVQEVRKIEENFFKSGCNGAYANLRAHMGTLYLQKFLNRCVLYTVLLGVYFMGVQVLRLTGHSSTIGIEEKNFDEHEKLQYSTRI